MIGHQSNQYSEHIYRTAKSFDPTDNIRVVRKFINSAIYVEKPILGMPPTRKISPLSLSAGNPARVYPTPVIKVSNKDLFSLNSSADSSTDSSNVSQETIKPGSDTQKFCDELRLSLTQLNSNRTSIEGQEKEELIKSWIARKEAERKRRQVEIERVSRAKEEQRRLLIEKEQENFKKWLAEKRALEEERKKKAQLEEMEAILRAAEKEKKKVENDLNFRLWLRRKKKLDLEKKTKEKIQLIRIYEEKLTRIEENERAYRQWLESSKNKPRPIPLNRGLQSLCSSQSVTYINPLPWNADVDKIQKPNSQ
ncbi:coiled-coil domain-containing protein 34-like [Cylas formicarius]|uniref:coiled-coil domain-containing protein 34-like n=1 Tax=Cylas formicarius TaxID=197179 RepID=UPI0029583EE2|nr:coiled-coil domain-containing protein 34-like [Cylas formicarius]